jgi:hypothetical protein
VFADTAGAEGEQVIAGATPGQAEAQRLQGTRLTENIGKIGQLVGALKGERGRIAADCQGIDG